VEELRDLEVTVRVERILRAHYPDARPAAPEVRATAQAMAEHALEIAAPRAWLRLVPLDAIADLSAGTVLHDAVAAQLFVVTLGPRLDERVAELFNAMDGLEGLFLDTAGWVLVQSALGDVRKRLAAKARSAGYRLTRRTGPGYLDWPIAEQRVLVHTLAAGEALPGIEVLESGAVLPEKTLTGLYGLIPLEPSTKE
jgi:hypothetical protein